VDGIEGETFNFGTGTDVSVGEVAQRIVALVGRDVPVVESEQRVRPPASEVARLVADWSKAHERLGWSPQVDLDEGLRRTVEWVRGSLHAFKTSIYNV
jgi:nucleoside-diphosphate-sugar epimerase